LADLIYAACFVLTIGVFVGGVITANVYLAATGSGDSLAQALNAQSHSIFIINIAYLIFSISCLLVLTGRRPGRTSP